MHRLNTKKHHLTSIKGMASIINKKRINRAKYSLNLIPKKKEWVTRKCNLKGLKI